MKITTENEPLELLNEYVNRIAYTVTTINDNDKQVKDMQFSLAQIRKYIIAIDTRDAELAREGRQNGQRQ